MKKQITILVLLLVNCSVTRSQIKITTPCNDELLKNTPGRWIPPGERLYAKISKQQQQVIINWIDKIHQFVFTIYPSPLGIDAVWYKASSDGECAQQVKYDHYPDGSLKEDFVNGIPVVVYSYLAKFYKYGCGLDKHKDEIMRGYPGEGGASFAVEANEVGGLLPRNQGVVGMEIGGRKILPMLPVKGKWNGYTLYQHEAGSGITMVLLHREGMLPYIPVTRKQYLDLLIPYTIKTYDKSIDDIDQMPVRSLEEQEVEKKKVLDGYERDYGKDARRLKSATDYYLSAYQTDQQRRDEMKNKVIQQKKDALKKCQDELAATTAAGLLETPAVIPLGICDLDTEHPIFTTESEGGRMLAIENPAYFRKDLPKYVPQCFVLLLERDGWSYTPKNEPIKLLEENFPIEKLQAMIDK
jgi:hypothetical protein